MPSSEPQTPATSPEPEERKGPSVIRVMTYQKDKAPRFNFDPEYLRTLPLHQQKLFATVNIPMPHWTKADEHNFNKGTLTESNFQGNNLTITESNE